MDALKSLSGFAHWLPRLALFGIFGYHGWGKLANSAGMADAMGMPVMMVLALGVIEVGGALLMVYGGFGPEWATQVAGVLFAVVMVGAIGMVHWQNGWNSIGNMGMEFQVLILATSFYFATKGNDAK